MSEDIEQNVKEDTIFGELLFRLQVQDYAEHAVYELFDKSTDDIMKEISVMSDEEKYELLDNGGRLVSEEFGEGGRWTNTKRCVYSFHLDRERVYVRTVQEVPATEMQEGGDFDGINIEQVFPHKVEATSYKHYPQQKESK